MSTAARAIGSDWFFRRKPCITEGSSSALVVRLDLGLSFSGLEIFLVPLYLNYLRGLKF